MVMALSHARRDLSLVALEEGRCALAHMAHREDEV
jgi:hypothetical protein